MKHVVSVSLGSSKRNKRTEQEFLGEKTIVERIGTDGSIEKAIEIIKELDGKVDAFGMGGIDLYVSCGKKRYILKDAIPIAQAAQKTPIVDGSRLKGTLERRVIQYLDRELNVPFDEKKVLLVSGMDRFGMAEALQETGCDLVLGDLVFILNIPIPLRSLSALDKIARAVAPIVVKLPFSMLYPTGEKQDTVQSKKSVHTKFYNEADIIAGDFLLVKKHMPEDMSGKSIITNTVTAEDVDMLRKRGLSTLITTTPEMDGRSFGTNVMEALIVALLKKMPEEITDDEINELLDRLNFKPRIEVLNPPSLIP
ncbi:MAG: quinate 5-dehydrogenase [Firmicutes bacterium]|nr:quinate 5-dehydrogenase [Candidatus Fermentithermobacillaceae bacterium]HON87085.1 quinate 5-dehydrogenase [Bacillota bacterium]HOV66225.1 quinate 5-dehydrogenase [Bacillota bacterium]HRC53542.1 quinate 5-dehydrogenase [Bacillota bacterium]